MNDELLRLWRLHELDNEIAACRDALKRFDVERRAIDERMAGERTRLEGLKQRVADVQLKRRQTEKDVEAMINEERKLESRLPAIKKNEEYTALRLEIANAKSKRSDLETQVLVQMEEEEKAQGERPAIERALQQAEKEGAERRAQNETEERADRERIGACDSERQSLVAGLPTATRSRYERIHSLREGKAVMPILKNACGGCYRNQPPQTLQEARKGERVLICDGCGRMLIWPPDVAA